MIDEILSTLIEFFYVLQVEKNMGKTWEKNERQKKRRNNQVSFVLKKKVIKRIFWDTTNQ